MRDMVMLAGYGQLSQQYAVITVHIFWAFCLASIWLSSTKHTVTELLKWTSKQQEQW